MSKPEKKARFKKLASKRTNEVLHRLKVLSNCSNRQLYDYDEKDIERIFSEIEKKIRATKAKFVFPKIDDEEFRL